MHIASDPSIVFIVWAPAFDYSSGGRVSLHGLANDMHRLGYNVFLYSPRSFPGAQVPLISDQGVQELRQTGTLIVAIYPEIVVGNVLQADYVVWWLLHIPGFHLNNWNGDTAWTDRIVCFHPDLALRCGADAKLTYPLYDPAFFFPRRDVERTEVLLYVNKIRKHPEVELSLAVKPTALLKPEDNLTYSQLRALFWRTRLVISYEWTGTLKIAKMCGAPIAYRESPIFTKEEFGLNGGYGHTWEMTAEGIAAAERTVNLEYLLAKDIVHCWLPALEEEAATWLKAAKTKGSTRPNRPGPQQQQPQQQPAGQGQPATAIQEPSDK